MEALPFESSSDARAHSKGLLDAAGRGRAAVVRRDDTRAAFIDAERLRDLLARSMPARVETVAGAGGWSVIIPRLPVAADGATFDEAIAEIVDALREYAADGQDHLLDAPNHRGNWGLVRLIAHQ